jgi:imidazolonepropionase-like amidohydrolase
MENPHKPQSQPNVGPWHVRGIRLPDGDTIEEWWIVDGVWSDRPVPGATPLPGGWFLPGGLVDAHIHRTMNFNGFQLPDGSDALVEANLAAQRNVGVLAVRDAGLAWGGWPVGEPVNGPCVQSAGNILAPPGRGYPGICLWVEPDQLVNAALAEVARGVQWVKLMGDFPGTDGNWFEAPANYPLEILEQVVQAVHAAGARIMAHTTGLAATDLVCAGVDSIEHGMRLNGEMLEQMAARNMAWSLTMSTALIHVGAFVEQGGPIGDYIGGVLNQCRELLPLAARLGVPLLAGTDELPQGAIATEIQELVRFGLTPRQALAAGSTGSRAFLGFASLGNGSPADLVTYTSDPRSDLTVLRQPTAIVFDGRRMARSH